MVTTADVIKALAGVKDPDLGRDLVDLGMIKDVRVDGTGVSLRVELTTPACPLKGKIEADVRGALTQRLPGLTDIRIEMGASVRGKPIPAKEDIVGIKNVIAVGSGKGGVGKSTIAASIAFGLQHYGAKVGVMDADVYGPSIPHLLGVSGKPSAARGKIQPLIADGLAVMSMGFLLEPERAVVWRGPMLHQAMQQFLREVEWGELDYLIIDLPPGTGDVPLSLSQILPLTGAVVVCTPQDVALLDALRAVSMFRQLKIPILGLVENMSHFECPHCGGRSEIFGSGGARDAATAHGIPCLGQIPINLAMRLNGDAGRTRDNYVADNVVRPHLLGMCEQLAAQVSIRNLQQPALPTLEVI